MANLLYLSWIIGLDEFKAAHPNCSVRDTRFDGQSKPEFRSGTTSTRGHWLLSSNWAIPLANLLYLSWIIGREENNAADPIDDIADLIMQASGIR